VTRTRQNVATSHNYPKSMITSIVTAIAITQREARREKQAREAEIADAANKSILVVGAGVSGLVTAVLCASNGFTVTLVDQRSEEGVVEGEREGVAMLGEAAVGVLKEVEELELKRGCETDAMVWKRAKSGKRLEISSIGMVFLESDLKELLLGAFTGEKRFGTRVEGYHDAHEDLDGPLPHGRPYVLTHRGERLYADCIIAADGQNGIGRRHVFASQQAEDTVVPTGWWKSTFMPGEPDEDEGVSLDKMEVHVADGSYLIAATVDGESVGIMYHGSSKPPVAEYHARMGKLLVQAETKELSISQKPAFLVSRASRKLVLCGSAAFTVPPHSPPVKTNFDIAASAALAVCLRKAASVPLGLEVWSRLANPRYVEVMMAAQERFNKVSGGAAEGELEVAEVKWEGWEWEGGKEAEKGFDDVVEALTTELLGKQMAMKEAALKQAQEEEEERQRREAEGEPSKTEGGDDSPEAEDASIAQEVSNAEDANDESSPVGGASARTAHTVLPVREIGERSIQEAVAPGQSEGKEVPSKEAGSDDNWHTVSPRDEVVRGSSSEENTKDGQGSADELQPFVQDAPDLEDGRMT
jgi:hypothetical protein